MIKVVIGDVLEAREDIICHQVNCQGVMGSGVAKALYYKWPVIKKDYMRFCSQFKEPKNLLGKYQLVEIAKDRFVANIFGQLDYGRDKNHRYTDYTALANSFDAICKEQHDKSLAFPFGFGCGLANGDWSIVYQMIKTCFHDMNVVIYKIPNSSMPDKRASIQVDMSVLQSAT